MQPQEPQLQDNPLPASYLDQIATPQKQPGMSNKTFLGIIIGAVVLVLIVGGLIFANAGGSTATTSLTSLAMRLEALSDVTRKADKNIQSGQLRAINTSINTYLLNANRDIQDPLEKNKIILGKASKKLVAAEEKNTSDLATSLEDARLLGTYDVTYQRVITNQLEMVSALMSSVYKSTKSVSLKKFLETSSKDLDTLYGQLKQFNPADPNNQFGDPVDNSKD